MFCKNYKSEGKYIFVCDTMQAITSVHNNHLGGTSPALTPIKLESLGGGLNDSLYDLVPPQHSVHSTQTHVTQPAHSTLSHHPDSSTLAPSHDSVSMGHPASSTNNVGHHTGSRLTVLTGPRDHETTQPPPPPPRGTVSNGETEEIKTRS